jgi:hypothetical protein
LVSLEERVLYEARMSDLSTAARGKEAFMRGGAVTRAALVVVFFLELTVLFASGAWGFRLEAPRAVTIAVGLAAPLAMAVLWWLVGSPEARFGLRGVTNMVFRAAWFGTGALALFAAGWTLAAAIMAAVYVLTETVLVLGLRRVDARERAEERARP